MTNAEVKKFYNSKAWKMKRVHILQRDKYECQDCVRRLRKAAEEGRQLRGEERRIRRASDVHHIKELKEHPELNLEDDNLISLCVECHNKRHGRDVIKHRGKRRPLNTERW